MATRWTPSFTTRRIDAPRVHATRQGLDESTRPVGLIDVTGPSRPVQTDSTRFTNNGRSTMPQDGRSRPPSTYGSACAGPADGAGPAGFRRPDGHGQARFRGPLVQARARFRGPLDQARRVRPRPTLRPPPRRRPSASQACGRQRGGSNSPPPDPPPIPPGAGGRPFGPRPRGDRTHRPGPTPRLSFPTRQGSRHHPLPTRTRKGLQHRRVTNTLRGILLGGLAAAAVR